MNDIPGGSEALLRSQSPLRTTNDSGNAHQIGTDRTSVSITFPSDPLRQEKRLPIRILKMLTAHSHLLHPEYLQPLTSAPVSIELDAKKSPLALLAQTCSQIGKPDPPSSSKLASLSSSSLSDKDSSSRSSKSGEQHQPLEDKSSFKPYSKSGGECRKDGLVTKGPSDKNGFRVPNGGSTGGSSSFPPHSAHSPSSGSPPLHTQSHRRSHSPASQPPANSQATHVDSNKPGSLEQVSSESNGLSSTGKKDTEHGKAGMDGAQLANSSHVRASANSSNASSASSPRPESKSDHQTSQPGLASGHVAPVSPFKPGHSVFPLPPANMGYHGSIVGAYAGYPSQFVPGLDHKSSLSGLGLQGKHPSSSPLTGASPPSLMQGLCRDPYCLTYPNASHLGGSSCAPCPSLHDPSSALKSGFPLMYSSHHLHSLHPGALSSSTSPSLSHPLYTYGFMLPNESQSHACNWVSMGGPCDKRFATSEELLAHLRTHTALPGGMDSKLLSSYPSASAAAAASCHLHLPPPGSPGSLPSSFSLRGSPGLSLARYHPYSKAHLPGGHGLPMHSLQASSPYYSPYALYSQRLGSASALGYQ